MKKIVSIIVALSLIVSSAYAEKTIMDRLTNDRAFEHTAYFFNTTTDDDSDSGEAYIHKIFVVPVAIIESVIWVTVLPFNAIKIGMED